jgi:hypothetical protein
MAPKIAFAREEREAMRRYRPQVAACLRFARSAHALYEDSIDAIAENKQNSGVVIQAMILNQLSAQVRVVTLAAERGYPLQALAGVATVYELAAAVGFISGHPDRAKTWDLHSSTRQSYPSSRERRFAMRSLLEAGGVSAASLDSQINESERRYEFFCMAKHGNPTVLRRYGVKARADRVTLAHGPVGGKGYYQMAQIAIFRAVHLFVMAVSVFAQPHLSALTESRSRALVKRFRAAAANFRKAAISLPRTSAA